MCPYHFDRNGKKRPVRRREQRHRRQRQARKSGNCFGALKVDSMMSGMVK
ncbi:MAG: hypothetical protein IJI71_10415 [Clostridia bacterium]|nr:hypothetical protein [Clostridia bacterium]